MAVGRRRLIMQSKMREKHQTEKQDDRDRNGSEGDHGFTFDVTAVLHHDVYSLQEHVDPGPCTSW